MDDEIRRAVREGTGSRPANVADALGLSLNGFYEAVKRGDVAVVRVGRRIIVPAREVRRLLGVEEREVA